MTDETLKQRIIDLKKARDLNTDLINAEIIRLELELQTSVNDLNHTLSTQKVSQVVEETTPAKEVEPIPETVHDAEPDIIEESVPEPVKLVERKRRRASLVNVHSFVEEDVPENESSIDESSSITKTPEVSIPDEGQDLDQVDISDTELDSVIASNEATLEKRKVSETDINMLATMATVVE